MAINPFTSLLSVLAEERTLISFNKDFRPLRGRKAKGGCKTKS